MTKVKFDFLSASVVVVGFAAAALYFSYDREASASRPPPIAEMVETPTFTIASGVTLVATSVTGSTLVSMTLYTPIPRPRLSLWCEEDACHATGSDAMVMLERIAARGVRVDVVVEDQSCQRRHEVVEPHPAEMAELGR